MLVQWLRLTPNAGGQTSVPGQRTRVPYATTRLGTTKQIFLKALKNIFLNIFLRIHR